MIKKYLFITVIFLLAIFNMTSGVYAQGMMDWKNSSTGKASDNHTAREEAEGKEIWEKLQAKQLECKNLTNDNYDSLGEYFMGQMTGNSHEAMNNMMIQMMGEEGEKQMHMVMGKRLSGCDTSAAFPSQGAGFMSMMQMMMGTGLGNMMGGWNGFGILGWMPMLLFWVLLILGVVALIRYLMKSSDNRGSKTPLDILKERYAKGEIDKKEFEGKKKDLL